MWKERLRHLWARHRRALLLFLGVSAVVAVLLVRLVSSAIYWADPAHRDQAIAPWMTPRYVARSWAVPPEIVLEPLGVTLGDGDPPPRRRNLGDFSVEQGRTFQAVKADLEAAINAFRAGR